jgi:lipopolysaccharide cholinephosphotransferase
MIYNTGETSEELKANYNPEGSVLRQAQCRMLDMLLYLDNVCREQHITYMLSDGNVLGALRHQGFIPWDDDVDVYVERKDWKRLVHYLKHHPHHQFVIQDHDTDPHYYGSWVILRDLHSEYVIDSELHNIRKFKGLQIDIFPIERGCNMFLHRLARAFTWWNNRRNGVSHPLLASFFYYFQFDFLYPVFRVMSRLFSRRRYYMHSYGAYWIHRIPVEQCFPPKLVMFEGHMLPCPAKPEEYLHNIFGEYMDLPPKNERCTHQAHYKIW